MKAGPSHPLTCPSVVPWQPAHRNTLLLHRQYQPQMIGQNRDPGNEYTTCSQVNKPPEQQIWSPSSSPLLDVVQPLTFTNGLRKLFGYLLELVDLVQ